MRGIDVAATGFNFIALTIIVGGMAGWIAVANRLRRGEPIVPYEPRRPATWGLIDLVIGFALWIALSQLCLLVAKQYFGFEFSTAAGTNIANKMALMLIGSLSLTLATVCTSLLIALRTQSAPRDLGWSFADLGRDLKLGLTAFPMLALPVYAIQLIAVQFQPSRHPLIEALSQDPRPEFFLIAWTTAVSLAPLCEEMLFRVLLQGWLEKAFDVRAARHPEFGAQLFTGGKMEETSYVAPAAEFVPSENPYQSPSASASEHESTASTTEPGAVPSASTTVVPILFSSVIFAILHYSHGPDWIALFVFAIGLGYLYRRTHRVVPSLVVHLLLNTVSMLGLCLQIYMKK